MLTRLFIRRDQGWHEIEGVVDVRVHAGKIQLENGQEINGDIVAIVMDHEPYDAGQMALRTLVQMEPRIVDLRIIAGSKLDLSVIFCGDEVDPILPRRYAVLGRVLGIRPAGQAPEWRASGGGVVGINTN